MDEDVVIMATLAWAGMMFLWLVRLAAILYLGGSRAFT